MAEDKPELEQFHYWGAVVLGFLGSGLLWLALGGGLIVQTAWLVIAALAIVAMNYLPERAAWTVKAVCFCLGFPLLVLLMGLMALMPGAVAYMFSRTIVETFPRWLQVGMLLGWFLLLVAISVLLYSRAVRREVREWLRTKAPEWLQNFSPPEHVEAWAAIALYINFVIIAMGCFASIAFLLHGLTPPLFLPAVREVDHGALADFLLWQLLDAIPGLKVPETIRWAAPLTYERSDAGWLVLLFKVMVIVPVVSGIGHYLRDEEAQGSDASPGTSGAGPSPRGA